MVLQAKIKRLKKANHARSNVRLGVLYHLVIALTNYLIPISIGNDPLKSQFSRRSTAFTAKTTRLYCNRTLSQRTSIIAMADPPPLRRSGRLRGEEPPGQVDFGPPAYTEPTTNPHVEDASASQLSNIRDTFSNAESLRFNEAHVPSNITITTNSASSTNQYHQNPTVQPNHQQYHNQQPTSQTNANSVHSPIPRHSPMTLSHPGSLLSYSNSISNSHNQQQHDIPSRTPTNNSSNASNFNSTSSSSTQFASQSDVQQLCDQISRLSTEHNNEIHNLHNRMSTVDHKLNTVAEHVNTIQASISTMTSTINDSITNAILAAMQQTTNNSTSIQTTTPTQAPTPAPTLNTSNNFEHTSVMTTNQPEPKDPIDITSLLQDHSSSSKPIFQTYNGKTDINKWQSLCLLSLSAHKTKYYQSFVKVTALGKRILDPDMPPAKRAQLFNITVQALDPKLNLEFITTDLIETADGIHLWDLILQRFKPALKGTFEKEDLKIEFRNMHKNEKETNQGFLKRVEQKLAYLQLHNLYISDAEKAVALLEGLRSEYLIQPVVQLRADGDSTYDSWIKPGDLQHTLECASRHIAQYVRYNSKVTDTRPKSYKTALSQNNQSKTPPPNPTTLTKSHSSKVQNYLNPT
jgi:hypothetical protein